MRSLIPDCLLNSLCLLAAAGWTAGPPVAMADEKPAAQSGAGGAAEETSPRPQTPPRAPDPKELELRPDDAGRVRFNFQGQPWLDVLEWVGEISQLSLDWQEVPAGYLNLRTQQSYSIEEARDLVNRHLLDRGFTLLRHGEILSVVNIKKLDPSLVPRLEPDELPKARDHDFVRVSFPLDWITAETAVEDLKPLISPNGKLTAIKSTNRLEAIDAVANLREIHKMLGDPQSPQGPRRMVREFPLEHVKATEVQPHLVKLLGLEKPAAAGDPQQLMQQMAQIMKQAGVAPGQLANQKPQGPAVHLVANARDNSILAHAPADQMAIIAEAIEMLDHPRDKSRSVLRNTQRVQVYPLQVAEPEATAKMLQDLADLAPETRLQVDRKNRSLVAHANLADHLTIRTLIEKLDRTVRTFRVVPLTRLDADYVAGSIDLVMGGGDATKRPPGRDPEEEARRFRVVADVEKNRLLLWVNEDEFEDVKELLAELGETQAEGAPAQATVRVIESLDSKQSDELLRKIEQTWPAVAPNPLRLGSKTRAEPAPAPAGQSPPPATARPPVRERQSGSATPTRDASVIQLARFARGGTAAEELPRDVPEPRAEARPAAPELPDVAPVTVERDAEGRIVITSQDPQAVELLQKLVRELGPTAPGFHVFRMKNKSSWAQSIAENLRQYFDERQKAEDRHRSEQAAAPRWYDPNGGKWITNPRGEADRRKPTRSPPKFIVDNDSNSILAVGADASQLKLTEELIAMYDTPETQVPHVVRVTRLVPIKHGQARQIADTVRDVYRDLLAGNDPYAGQRKRAFDPALAVAFGGKRGNETLIQYKGQLSIGVDESSQTVVIAAPEALAETVERTVHSLDEAARENRPRVKVVRIAPGVDPVDLQKRLMQAINKR